MKLNKKGANALFFGVVAASSLLLVACGGGGGGGDGGSSSLTYTGITTAATVDDTSAPVLADSVISTSSTDASSVTSFVGVSGAAGGASAVERLKGIVDMAKSLAATPAVESLAGAQASGNGTIQGCYGSSVAINVSYDDTFTDKYGDPILYSMSLTFKNYVNDYYGDGTYCGTETLNGKMSVTVSYDGPLDSMPELNGMNITLSNLSVTEGGLNQVFNGSLGMSINTATWESTFTMTANFRDTDGLVYRAQNYTVNFDSSERVTSISGRLYHPSHGYVDITTTTDLSYTGSCSTIYGPVPDAGVVTLSGNGTITLDAATGNCATYQVSWVNGDGSASGSSLEYW